MRDVRSLDSAELASAGIRALLLDVDNTLLPRDTADVAPDVRAWIASLEAVGIAAYLVSNNWHDDIHDRAAAIGLPVVAKACKPLPFGFRVAMRRLGRKPSECAVVGDQIFTDVLGGNLVGSLTVLVQPLSESDLPHTLVLRRLERFIMAGRSPAA